MTGLLKRWFGKTLPEPIKEPSWKRNFALSPEARRAAHAKSEVTKAANRAAQREMVK